MKSNFRSIRIKALILVIGLALLFSMMGTSLKASAAGTGPCDIYASAGNTCVAAHSTVRALYGAYNGRLYQVRRASNSGTLDISTLSAGGFANAAAQDSFCSGTTCVITVIYDQSGHGNDLWYQGSGSPVGGHDNPSSATSESLTVSGNKVYSLYINPANSYWRNGSSSGIPTGSAPEGLYMVTSGTHVNSGCCFDYGNSETSRTAVGAGHMDAIYFGTSCWFGGCSGTGPWVQADLEYGLFPGGSSSWNPNQKAFTNKYVTAMLKNNGTTLMALKGANAQSGSLTTLYSGSLPNGYNPMKKEGAIVLGSGGDCCATNTNQSLGTFYEGAIVTGYPSDTTDNSIQANIVAAGYGSGGGVNPTATPSNGSYVQLINQNSNKCLDVQSPNTADGANVGIYSCNGNTWQKWQLVDLGTGYFKIVSQNSGKCLDVTGNGTADGVNVEQWTCNGGTNQQWQKTTTTSPWFRLTARNSGKVLDVNGCGTADGTNVQQWTWLNNSCQQWKTQ